MKHDDGRQAAEELDVDARDPTVWAHRRQPHEGEDRPEDEAEDEGAECIDDGVEQRAPEALGQGVVDQVTTEEDLIWQSARSGGDRRPGQRTAPMRMRALARGGLHVGQPAGRSSDAAAELRPAAGGSVTSDGTASRRGVGITSSASDAEPLLVDRLVGAVWIDCLQDLVEGALDLGRVRVVLLEEEPVLLTGVELLDDLVVGVVLGEVEQRAVVVDGPVDPAGLDAGDLGRQVVEDDGLVAVGVLVLLGVGLAGRVGLDTELLALQGGQVGDPRGLLDEQGLRRAEVRRRRTPPTASACR